MAIKLFLWRLKVITGSSLDCPWGHVLVLHTFADVVDDDIFDGEMRWIGLHLSFEEEVIHRIPHGLPSHRLCGAHALAFIAHVLLDVDLLDSLEELDTMRVNMRASFVQAMHEGHTCICPIVWGEGGRGALIKSLPDELCTHGVPTHTCLSSEPRRPSRPLEATNCSKPCNRSSHGNN